MAKPIYLDYSASTPVDKGVQTAMAPYFGTIFGNPHALHRFGQQASAAVFDARRTIGKALGADYKEIVFTGSATEANNLAIRGIVSAYRANHKSKPKIVTSAIEHESILETCRALEKEGVEVAYIPVSGHGFVDMAKLKAAIDKRTILVSIMHANNEVGTIQPLQEIAKIIAEQRGEGAYPLLHTDAVQSFQYVECGVNQLGVDLMTLSAHKIYGPKGIGVLYIKNLQDRKNSLQPIITGSGQEFGLRSGTDNVPYIVGFAKAVEITERLREKESARIGKLREYFWKNLHAALPKLKLNGAVESRLPNNLNIYFPGRKAQELLIELDLAGIAVSPGAACSTRVSRASYVLEEMGFPAERATGSLRFSLGRQTTKSDLDYATKQLARMF